MWDVKHLTNKQVKANFTTCGKRKIYSLLSLDFK